jgi:hypothetical protein
MPDEGTSSFGMSRRDLIRRGAIAGGALVWAVPVVQSISSSSAFGATTIGSIPCNCNTPVCSQFVGGQRSYQVCTLNPNSCACVCACQHGFPPPIQTPPCSCPDLTPVYSSCGPVVDCGGAGQPACPC